MKTTIQYIIILSALIFASCTGNNKSRQQEAGDGVEMKHAKNISIKKYSGYTVATLSDPWNKGKTLHTYILVPAGQKLPDNMPGGTVIRTPLTNMLVSTSVHCSLLTELDRNKNIGGVFDAQYIKIPWIKKECEHGRIIDCGSSMSPSIEKIIELNPDAILLSPFQNSGGYGKLDKLKIPIIEVAEYMEPTALGRAEWIKFYGMLFGAEEQAGNIFKSVEAEYARLKELAKTSKVKKSILMDTKTGAVWYVPGGNSTIGQLIKDACIEYPFGSDSSSGSLSLSFETVLEQAADADIWLLRYSVKEPFSLNDLRAEYEGYSQFKAFKTGNVYGCNTVRSTFYEDTPFHPERLLRDFVTIAHPDLDITGDTQYFFKLK